MFIWVRIIKSIENSRVLSPFTLHTRTISHTKAFLRQPNFQGIQIRSPCNVRQIFFTNKPSQKIYCCIPARSTEHYTLLHNSAILHTKTFFARKHRPRQNCHILRRYTDDRLKRHYLRENMIKKNSSQNISLLPS